MSKTRRHIAPTRHEVYTPYRYAAFSRFDDMRNVTIRFIVNTGNDYRPKPPPLDGTTYTREVKGHGWNTSRVRRTKRKALEALARFDGDWLAASAAE